MLKKKFIFENEEEVEKSDFQKILDLNKKRLSPYEVEFYNSNGEDFSDYIEVTQSGLIFTFDGLKDYLKFFFPEEYGEDNSDGEYDAANYEYMYEGRYDWGDEFWNRSYDDWHEGYIVDAFRSEHFKIVKDIAKYISPSTYKLIYVDKNKKYKCDDNAKLASFLSSLGLEDKIMSEYVGAQVDAVRDAVPEGIKDTYCDCLKEVGIENYSGRHCFWKYELDWGSAILFFARFGTENDKLLDLLFEGIKKIKNIRHLPEYYEMQYNYWDNEAFNNTWVPELEKILDDKFGEILEDDNYKGEYYEILDKIIQLGGFDIWKTTKNKKHQVKITNIDDETNQITYQIKELGKWETKVGKTDLQSLINLLNNESLFDPMEHRKN